MDIKVVQSDHNQVQVFTRAGTQLVGDRPASIIFDAKGSLSAASQWDADPNKRSVGTLLLDPGSGNPSDMITGGMIGSGKIAALLEMRDQVLTGAQAQLDQIAAAMSSALSDRTTAGTAASAGSQSGFDLDIGSLLSGNKITVTYTDTTTNTQRTVTLVRVDDPRVLPLSNGATPTTGDKVVGIDFSGGFGSALAQISSALGPAGLYVSNPSGTTLRVLDSGAGGKVALNALTATATTTSLINGGAELPLFLDGTKPYSGAIGALGKQTTGFAGRIASIRAACRSVAARRHADLAADLGCRCHAPNFILDRLTRGVLDFAPEAGVGTAAAPFSGSLQSYIRQMISQQGEAAANADSLNQGQQVVVNTLQQRFADKSNVNIDQEMANLMKLQTAYGANARVLSAAKDMLDQLFQVL
jgi:flagellar hook-associated protein 1 FlgK